VSERIRGVLGFVLPYPACRGILRRKPCVSRRNERITAVLLASVLLAGCASYHSTNPSGTSQVTVTISPMTAQAQLGKTQQFTAAVSNSTNTAVTWQVNGATSGNATNGTINSSGLYTAPSTMPASASVSITAVSQADQTKSATATLTITAPTPTPTVTLAVNPTSINSGASSTLTWSSTNATSCTASGGWSGAESTSGAQSVSPTATATYTLNCTGTGGSANASATVTVNAATPAPTVTLTANPVTITAGGSSTLQWSTTNATSCTASGGWNGSEATSGTKSVTPSATTTYTLTCSGAGGSSDASATITVNPATPKPTVTLTANPSSINSGATSTLTWSSTNASACTASGGWSGAESTSGTQSVSPTATTTYTLACTGAGGSADASATITVSSSSSAFSIGIKGNTFVDGSGNVIQPRGVNLSGMEFVAIQGWDPSDPTGGQFGQANNPKWSAIQAWKANIVRIPLNEDSWLALTCTDTSGVVHNADPGNNYKQALANLVSEANASGLYVILDLHWAAPGNACPMLQSQMADADHSLDFWTSIATTYKNNPAVLFELFNEPYFDFDFSGDQWEYMMFGQNGAFSGYPATSNSGNWQNVMTSWNVASYQAMINAVRATGATNVVLIGSVGYTGDLSGWLSHEPADPLHQMAATWHAYPTYGQTWENPCTGTDTYCTPGNSPQIYTEVQAILQAGVPVLITETGDQDSAGTVGSPNVANVTAFADAPATSSTSTEPSATWPAVPGGLPQIGVLGWTWDVWTGPNDILILDVNGTPTPGYGQFFQSWLVNHP
jgi:endoglucanase